MQARAVAPTEIASCDFGIFIAKSAVADLVGAPFGAHLRVTDDDGREHL